VIPESGSLESYPVRRYRFEPPLSISLIDNCYSIFRRFALFDDLAHAPVTQAGLGSGGCWPAVRPASAPP